MNWLQAIAHSPAVTHLGWTMLHFLWQGLAIALALRLVLAALRNGGPQARYLAAGCAMGLLALAPVVTYSLLPGPASPEGVRLPTRGGSPSTLDPELARAEWSPAAPPHVGRLDRTSAPTQRVALPLLHSSGVRNAPGPSFAERATAALARVAPWLVFPWAAGVVLLSMRNLGGWLAVRKLRTLTTRPAGEAIDRMAASLRARLGVRRAVRVLQSVKVDSPLVIGLLKPIILVPASMLTELPAAQIEALLAHELAHVLRNDYLVNLFQCAIETLLFYHPAVWWVSRQLRIEREHCCDDLAVAVTQERETYARALAAVADVRLTNLVPAASGGGVLMPRLRRILGRPAPDVARSSSWLTAAIALAACLVLVASVGSRLTAHAAVADAKKSPHTQPADSVDPDDVIRPGDTLRISTSTSVNGGRTIDGDFFVRVDADGQIGMPNMGAVKVGGSTADQATVALGKTMATPNHRTHNWVQVVKANWPRAAVGPIQPGDPFEVTLIGPPANLPPLMTYVYHVGQDGTIAFSFLKKVRIAGLTETAAQAAIEKAYAKQHPGVERVGVAVRDGREPLPQRTPATGPSSNRADQPDDTVHLLDPNGKTLAGAKAFAAPVAPELAMNAAAAEEKTSQPSERIEAGDLLDVSVAGLQGPHVPLTKRVRVATDGTASLYYIKPVKLAGLTFDAAQQAVEKAYLDAYHLPQGAKTSIKRIESGDHPSVRLGLMQPGDEIELTIFGLVGATSASRHVLRIERDGEIALPYIGTIRAAGLDEQGLERAIGKAYRDAHLLHDALVAVLKVREADEANQAIGPIGAGDLLQISMSPNFEGRPPVEVTFDVRVDAEGRIGMPRAGVVKVAGMSAAQATIAVGKAMAALNPQQHSVIWILKLQSGDRAANATRSIRGGDFLEITIISPPESGPLVSTHVCEVARDGTIPFPLMHKVTVAGLTEAAAQAVIEKAYVEQHPSAAGIAVLRAPPQSAPATGPSSGRTDQPDDLVRVKGRVLDPSGKPVAGAKVFAAPDWPNGPTGDRPAVVADATTGADGRFDLSFSKSAVSRFSLGDGRAGAELWKKTQIAARADGYGMDWQRFDHVDPATGDLVLRLVPDLPLKGRIVDPEGRPVPGVVVTVGGLASAILTRQSDFEHPPADLRDIRAPLAATGRTEAIVSDADGRFEIAGLGRDRPATLNFSSEKVTLPPRQRVCTRERKVVYDLLGSKERDAHFDIPGNTFELTATPARSVVGVVRDARTHKPLGHVRVFTSYARLDASTMTDEQGRYRLAPLERGQHIEITAESTDEPYVPAIFDLPEKPATEPLARDIDMIRGVWITGKVVDAKTGAPIPASVNFQPLASNRAAAAIPMFHLGYARCPCNAQTAPDGTYRLVGVSGPAVIALMLRDNPEYFRGQGFDAIKSRDRAGRVASMFPGIVTPGIYYAAREIIARPDDVTRGVDFQLQRGDSIHVTCTGPQKTPIRKLYVSGNNTSLSNNGALIEGAQFDVVGLAPGETRPVMVRDDEQHLGKVAQISAADARDHKLTITLEPMGTVTGRLLTLRGEPIAGGLLRVSRAVRDLRRTNHIDDIPGHSGPDGRFKIELPVGCPYILGASASPYGERIRFIGENLIDLAPGGTKDMGDLQPDAKPPKE